MKEQDLILDGKQSTIAIVMRIPSSNKATLDTNQPEKREIDVEHQIEGMDARIKLEEPPSNMWRT